MAKITSTLDYVNGYLRYAHYELFLEEGPELENFKNSSIEEQKEILKEEGELILDDYEVNDCGNLNTPKIEEKTF